MYEAAVMILLDPQAMYLALLLLAAVGALPLAQPVIV